MEAQQQQEEDRIRCTSGVKGLDEILGGGLPCHSLYVVQGEPGSGKTTLALQFMLEGIRRGEKSLYVTFSETRAELERVARSHGWNLDPVEIIDYATLEERLVHDTHTTIFHPSEVELSAVTEVLLKRISETQPERVVFDSISEMRLLAETPLRYRRQILSLKQALAHTCTTVLFLDDLTVADQDLQVQSVAHGVLSLSRLHHDFGGERRRLRVLKLRGAHFIAGYHDFDIERGGLVVYPRMISSQFDENPVGGRLTSGSLELDSLLGGGLDRGTSNLVIGPAGTGKSTLSLTYALSATRQGDKVAYFCFDETITNCLKRSASLGLDVAGPLQSGALRLQKVDPAEMSPGAFSAGIQRMVADEGITVVVIDSLNGYVQAMPQEQFLVLLLHELLAFLNNHGVVTILTLAQQGMVGAMLSPVDLTYLADTIVLTRFFESHGAVKKAISVIKKRTGAHESTIREYAIEHAGGVRVGKVLEQFQGILTGVPRYQDKPVGLEHHT